jgi:hypothetical protein
LFHADLAINGGATILSGFPCMPERGDGTAEQQQRPGHILPGGLEPAFISVPRSAEQRPHVLHPMPFLLAEGRGQAPKPRSGASRTPGLRSASGQKTMKPAVLSAASFFS